MTTTMRTPVVVGIDGTPESRTATGYAAWEAERRHVGLRLVYAHQPTPVWGPAMLLADDYTWEREADRDLLRMATKEVTETHPDLAVEAAIVQGGPAAVLVAESAHASLIVVGTRATTGVRGHLSGSVAAQVAAHAATPVIAVRTTAAWQADPASFAGRPVVVGIDGSEESMRALEFAVEEAVARRAPLHAVFVWDVIGLHNVPAIEDDNYDPTIEAEKADRLLAEATSGWSDRYPDLKITHTGLHAVDAAGGLCRAAREAALLVIGSRGHGGFLGLRLGSTVDALIRQSPAPVVAVRGTVDVPR